MGGSLLSSVLEAASVYAIAACGVLIAATVLEFYDLTVDGSFSLGGAVTALVLIRGHSPALAILVSGAMGILAGAATSTLARLQVEPLLAGILTMFALYSVNLRIMGASNVSVSRYGSIYRSVPVDASFFLIGVALCAAMAIYWLLITRMGALLRSATHSPHFLQSMGMSAAMPISIALCASNLMVAVSGSLMAQLQEYSDIGMGEGTLIYSLASIVIGRAIVGTQRHPARFVASALIGSLAYQAVVAIALRIGIAPTDLRIITAALIVGFILIGRVRRTNASGATV